MAEEFTINLSRDQALVLSHWLDEVMGTPEFDEIVNRDPPCGRLFTASREIWTKPSRKSSHRITHTA